MNRRALAANIPPMPNTRIPPVADSAERLARAMEAVLDNGGVDDATVQEWARQVRELGRVLAAQRREELRQSIAGER